MPEDRVILVTGFEPFGAHTVNASGGLAKAVDGRRVGAFGLLGAVLADASNTAGTYLCNQKLYWTLHAVRQQSRPPRVGFVHFPLLPSMVAASGLEQPSMDFPLMLRAVETLLHVIAREKP